MSYENKAYWWKKSTKLSTRRSNGNGWAGSDGSKQLFVNNFTVDSNGNAEA
jgi:hypothetical protein